MAPVRSIKFEPGLIATHDIGRDVIHFASGTPSRRPGPLRASTTDTEALWTTPKLRQTRPPGTRVRPFYSCPPGRLLLLLLALPVYRRRLSTYASHSVSSVRDDASVLRDAVPDHIALLDGPGVPSSQSLSCELLPPSPPLFGGGSDYKRDEVSRSTHIWHLLLDVPVLCP